MDKKKADSFFNIISHQQDADKTCLHNKDPNKPKYHILFNLDNIYETIRKYHANRKRQILIVFYGMITDILSNKNLNPVETELFIRVRKLNISLVFLLKSYFTVPKNIRLNYIRHFIMKIPNKAELQQTAVNLSSDIDFNPNQNGWG